MLFLLKDIWWDKMMKLNTEFYTGDMNEWDNFVYSSRNGTLFHTQKFLSYHQNKDFVDRSLIIKSKKGVECVFPAASIRRDGKHILFSHIGSSFGGLIVSSRMGIEGTHQIIKMILEISSSYNYDEIEMRLTPYIYHKIPCDEIQFCLLANGFKPSAYDLSCVIPLNDMMTQDQTTNKSIRKAINTELRVSYSSPDWERYWVILSNNLKEKHNVLPTHTLEEILRLKNLFPDKIRLMTTYLDDIMTSGVVLFVGNDRAFEVFYIAQDYNYQEYRCMSLLLHHVIDWGFSNGYRFINLGISTEDHGTKINWGLFKFKEGFGARSVLRPSFKKVLI